MKKLVFAMSCAVALLSSAPVWADEADAEGEAEVAEAAEGEVQPKDAKVFFILPCCKHLEGIGQVLKPGAKEWEPLKEGRHYPLGSSYRTVGADARLTVQFGLQCDVEVAGDATFGTRPQPLSVKSRTVVLDSGKIAIKLPRNFAEGLFAVAAPGFTVNDLAGESTFSYTKTGDGDDASLRCVTGQFAVKGRHFSLPKMGPADEVRIRTSQDLLFSALYGVSGDCETYLDQGLVQVRDFETQETKIEQKTLQWNLSPLTAVRIQRAVPEIGKKLSVSVMTFDAAGSLKNRCAFAEGLYEVNTGEQGPVSQKEKEALEKKAAEVAEAAEGEEAGGEEEKTEESSTEE